MRFAGPDEERLRKAREKSFNYLQQQVAKDPWLPLNYHPINSEFSSTEKTSLIYNSSQDLKMRNDSNNDNNTSIASLEEFLSTIKYSIEEDIQTKSYSELYSCSLDKPSLSRIRDLPLTDQIPDEDISQILSQMALFDRVQKRWNFLLPEDRHFIEKYPFVAQRQELLWKHRF